MFTIRQGEMLNQTQLLESQLREILEKHIVSNHSKDCVLAVSNGISEDCAAVIRMDKPPRVMINELWIKLKLLEQDSVSIINFLQTIVHELPGMVPSLTFKPEYLAISSDLKQLWRFSDYRFKSIERDEDGSIKKKRHLLTTPEYTGLSKSFIGEVDQSRFRVTLHVEVLDELTGICETRDISHVGFRDWDINNAISEAADKVAMNVARFDSGLERHLERFEDTDWLDIKIEKNMVLKITERRTVKLTGHRRAMKKKGYLKRKGDKYLLLTKEEALKYEEAERQAEDKTVKDLTERAKELIDDTSN